MAGTIAPKRTGSSRAESSRAGSSSEIPPIAPEAAPPSGWPAWETPVQHVPHPMETDAPPQGAGEEDMPAESEEQQQQDAPKARRQKRMARKKAVPAEFDATRFVSALAQYNFNRMSVGSSHPEQGLDLAPRGKSSSWIICGTPWHFISGVNSRSRRESTVPTLPWSFW